MDEAWMALMFDAFATLQTVWDKPTINNLCKGALSDFLEKVMGGFYDTRYRDALMQYAELYVRSLTKITQRTMLNLYASDGMNGSLTNADLAWCGNLL